MIRAAVVSAIVVGIGLFLLFYRWSGTRLGIEAEPPATFVGSGACATCHADQAADWQRSHHKAAMAEATVATVLGDFSDASFSYAGIRTQFFRQDGRFLVRTDGPDGQLADFEVAYTFGVEPLQQYLVELPGGRLQALSIAWDTRPAAEGGQRWFHLYPDEGVTHLDELHWTRPSQNWNFMCADCHSTALRKNYDPTNDRFDTHWAEISVGCEACHGPGSAHVDWATGAPGRGPSRRSDNALRVRLDERRNVTWNLDPATGQPRRSAPRTSDVEIQICAQCHSRRAQIADGYEAGKPFFDYYSPVLLERPLYYADGQQREEVYTWGSFLQSRMYAAGVTCTDCHNPHSGQLRAEGNAVCTTCHLSARYEAATHHHHEPTGAGAVCTSCHMPATSYMVVDPRHDHSLRVPRPDLTESHRTPNACNGCHQDRDAAWAVARLTEWFGARTTRGDQDRVTAAFAAADARNADAQARLRELASDPTQSSIVRATALSELNVAGDPGEYDPLVAGLYDPDPTLRLGALESLATLPPQQRASLAGRLLSDPVRAVRIEAAAVLGDAAGWLSSEQQRTAFERSTREYIETQHYNADRADARVNLATLFANQGDARRAETELETAIRLDPFSVPAYVNLADLHRALGRETAGEHVLRQGLERVPASGLLHHALGLALVRLNRVDAALGAFENAATLEPENARFAYVYAVALYAGGNTDEAIAVLERGLAAHPADPEILAALASYHAELGATEQARSYADRLRAVSPRR